MDGARELQHMYWRTRYTSRCSQICAPLNRAMLGPIPRRRAFICIWIVRAACRRCALSLMYSLLVRCANSSAGSPWKSVPPGLSAAPVSKSSKDDSMRSCLSIRGWWPSCRCLASRTCIEYAVALTMRSVGNGVDSRHNCLA